VMLWVDWQSIYQDDKEEKMKGVRSLIKYATLSDYMLVPTEEEELSPYGPELPYKPDLIPGYGTRGWCRVEYFIFSLAAEMRGRKAQLYGIHRNGSLRQYPKVIVTGNGDMPSQGDLSNPNDKALVQALEDTIIEAYGKVIVELKCKEPRFVSDLTAVKLSCKMIRDCHVEALCEAVSKYKVKNLDLSGNQLGDAGAEAIAAMLRTNRSLQALNLRDNKIGDAGKKAVREAVEDQRDSRARLSPKSRSLACYVSL